MALRSDGRCHLEPKNTELELATARCSSAPGPRRGMEGKRRRESFRAQGFRQPKPFGNLGSKRGPQNATKARESGLSRKTQPALCLLVGGLRVFIQ